MNEYTLISFAVILSSFILTVLLEKTTIPLLSKIAKQPIYNEGPSWHASKSGTPTMGGVAFIIPIFVSLGIASAFLLSTGRRSALLSLLTSLSFAIYNALIGAVDDITKLKRKQNAGLSPFQKLAFQFIGACAFLAMRAVIFGDGMSLSFFGLDLELGILYYRRNLYLARDCWCAFGISRFQSAPCEDLYG